MIAGLEANGGDLLGIGRPDEGAIDIVIALAAVGAQWEFQLLRLVFGPDEDVVVADEDLPLGVGRGFGLGRCRLGRGTSLTQPSSARAAGLDRAELGQGAGFQLELPAERFGLELDGLLAVDEQDRRERQLLGIDPFLQRAGQLGRHPDVVKSRRFRSLVRNDQDELEAAGHRLAVPEAVSCSDPGGTLRQIDGQALPSLAQRGGPLIVGASALGRKEDREHKQNGQDDEENREASGFFHTTLQKDWVTGAIVIEEDGRSN
jgi:hypothetical protein